MAPSGNTERLPLHCGMAVLYSNIHHRGVHGVSCVTRYNGYNRRQLFKRKEREVTKSMQQIIDEWTDEEMSKALQKVNPKVDAAKREWLEHTQQMRVVALNEAVALGKTKNGLSEARTIVEVAAIFAAFLIDGKVK